MTELNDDAFMGMAASQPTGASSEMNDDAFMSAGPKPLAPQNAPQDNTSFAENPSWDKLGKAAIDAFKDTNSQMIAPVARAGAIARGWGGQDATTKKFDPSDLQDWLAMGTPLIPGPEGTAAIGEGLAKVPSKIGEAVSAPVKTLANGYNASTPEELQTETQTLHSSANPYYTQMRNIGATYTPGSINELVGNVQNAIADKDVLPELSPVSADVAQKLQARADTGDLSLNHLDQYRRMLRNATGEDSAVAGAVRKVIDNHVNETTGDDLNNGSPQAVALLNRGRAESARAFNFDDVASILQKANGDPTKIKNGLNNFMADDSNTVGMTADEKAALRRASQTSSAEMATKMLGKAGFTVIPTGAQGNGVLPYIISAGELGGHAMGANIPGGFPLVAAGTLSKAGNTLYGRGLAENALDTIRNRPMPSADFTPPEPTGGVEDPNDATFETPKALPQQARGGRTKATQKSKTGVVYAKPKSYPALQKRQTP